MAAHTLDGLAHAGAVHRRRRDRRLGDLDAGHARQAGRRRPGQRRSRRRKRSATGDERDRDLPPGWIVALTIACLAVAGWLAYALRRRRPRWPAHVAAADVDRRAVRVHRRLRHRRRRRLHGRTDRRVEQPGVGHRHPGRRHLRVDARRCALPPTPETRPALVAFALFVTAHRLRLRDDLQRQPAGPQDRPAGRRLADAAADCPDRRRGRRRGGHLRRCSTCWRRPTASPARPTSAWSRRIRCRRRRRR